MKTKKVELDVDFIGGQRTLTKSEERIISEFIKAEKRKKSNNKTQQTKLSHKKEYLLKIN